MSTALPVPPPVPAPLQPIAKLFEQSLSIHHVYGEPIRQGDLTVVPVAKVAFGFGAGVGRRASRRQQVHRGAADDVGDVVPGTAGRAEPEGIGGGGGARLTPVGALEITPRGTRFVHYGQVPQLLGALAVGIGAGLLLARGR